MTITTKISLILLPFSAIFITVGIVIYMPTFELLKHGSQTTGEVVDLIEHSSNDGSNTYAPVIHYTCGKSDITETSKISSTSHPNIGDTVRIYCMENKPEEFVIDSFMDKYFGLIFVVAGLIPLCISLGMLIYQSYRNKSVIELKSSGERIEGKVLMIRQNTMITVMGKHPYIIEVEYRDSLNSYYLFKSDNLWKDPSESTQAGKTIGVFVERGDLKKYWVDTSFLESESTL